MKTPSDKILLILENKEACEQFEVTEFEATIEDIMQMEDEWEREEGVYERAITRAYAR